jgi:hypothetical protein
MSYRKLSMISVALPYLIITQPPSCAFIANVGISSCKEARPLKGLSKYHSGFISDAILCQWVAEISFRCLDERFQPTPRSQP